MSKVFRIPPWKAAASRFLPTALGIRWANFGPLAYDSDHDEALGARRVKFMTSYDCPQEARSSFLSQVGTGDGRGLWILVSEVFLWCRPETLSLSLSLFVRLCLRVLRCRIVRTADSTCS